MAEKKTAGLDVPQALPAGTRFGDLEIVRTLGVGGFGIVYLARDHALQRMVAIKEYMPGELAHRSGGSQVMVRSGTFTQTFDTGRRSFVHEARLLARFDHRSLLKVYQFWEANGTAYMVMPYLSGQTLKQARQAMARPPSEAWLLRVMLPLLDALERLHAESVLHRDISPDNILLPDDGADPILLDFGAARRAIGDQTQTITAILKPRFAPIEQYGESNGLRQGPWTDLYALGAVMHFLILGRTPPQATTRAVADEYEPLEALGPAGLSRSLLAAIDWALRVHPQDRPQTATEMRAVVQGARGVPPPMHGPAQPGPKPAAAVAAGTRASADQQPTIVVEPVIASEAHVKTIQLPTSPIVVARRALASPNRRSTVLMWALAGGGALALAALATGWWPKPAVAPEQALPREEFLPDPPPVVALGAGAGADQPVTPSAASAAAAPATRQAGPGRVRREPGSPVAAAAQAVPARAGSPSEACAGSSVFMRWRCVEQECAKPAWATHSECVQLREAEGRREGTRNAN
jgi:hypothetical protein